MQNVPRVYQKAAVKAALVGLRGRLKRALVVLATGLGKTFTAALIAKEFRGKRILFLVHNNFILKHAVDEFQLVFDKKTKMATYNGMSKDGAKEANIVFSTWQTMNGSLRKWAHDHFDLIIVDEAHHSEADTYRPVLDYFDAPKLGITATPERQDKADIRDVFGPEVINVTLEEAIARGWLPRIEYHVITDESLDEDALQKIVGEIQASKKRFTMAEVNRRIFIKKRDVEIARIINGYDEKSIVFCASIAHAERIAKSLKLAAAFHSKKGNSPNHTWNQNQETLDRLKNGIIRRVCAVNAFNEGVNVPSVGLVAFCRVTGAVTIFRQQLGRGLRPGKEKLIVLDFVGNLERIQLVLGMMNRISDLHEQYTPKKEIEREGYVRRKFEVSGKGFEFTFSDKVVDLLFVMRKIGSSFSRDELLQQLKSEAQRLGRTPYSADVDSASKKGRCACGATFANVFGSYNAALVAAGLTLNVRRKPTKPELIQQLKIKAKELGRPPRQEEVATACRNKEMPSHNTFIRMFGSWNSALTAAGLSLTKVSHSKEDLLNKFRAEKKRLRRTPTPNDIMKASKEGRSASIYSYYKTFGSWKKLLKSISAKR